jgi:geranylgeranyl diphosphate synthase type II
MVTDILEKTKRLVWPEIEKYLKDPLYPPQFEIPEKYTKYVGIYWKINREYPERKGKYLRPTFVRLTAEALGLKSKKIIQVTAAMQISEEWILISDDIQDHSDSRRGKPSLHKLYGVEQALNASNVLENVMWKMMIDVGSNDINDELFKIIMRTTLGQSVEMLWTSDKDAKFTDDKYFFIADSKSAYYTIAGPMRLGAILAGATQKQLNSITEFGLYLGRCFQLVDDLLDLDQDKKEGKITLANTKGVDYTKKLAEEMKSKAKEIFDSDLGFLKKEPARSQLKELIEFILEREY